MATVDFTGKWKLATSENYDELFTAMGLSTIKKKLALSLESSVFEMAQTGNEIIFTTTMLMMPFKTKIVIGGERVEKDRINGGDMHIKDFMDGNKLVSEVSSLGMRGEMYIEDDILYKLDIKGDVVGKKTYKRLK